MPIDTAPSTVATSALQAIPFSSLIGGPLDAAISAQAQAAKTSWEFIQNVGLNTNPDTQTKEAVNVTFYYNKDGQMTKLIVPLLTIVPIPYIAVDEINIEFMANISAASSSVTTTDTSEDLSGSAKAKGKVGWGPFSLSAELNANYSSKKASKASQKSRYSVEYTMNVDVHASQSDMPAGLASVLNILQGSITEGSKNGEFTFSSLVVNSTNEGDNKFNLPVTVVIKNSDGVFVSEGTEFKITGPAAAPKDITILSPDANGLTKKVTKNGQLQFEISGDLSFENKTSINEEIRFTINNTELGLSDTFSVFVNVEKHEKDPTE